MLGRLKIKFYFLSNSYRSVMDRKTDSLLIVLCIDLKYGCCVIILLWRYTHREGISFLDASNDLIACLNRYVLVITFFKLLNPYLLLIAQPLFCSIYSLPTNLFLFSILVVFLLHILLCV